jgi:hypothetical protein
MRVEFEWARSRRGKCVGSDRLLAALGVQARDLVSVGKCGAGERKRRQFAGRSVWRLRVPDLAAEALQLMHVGAEINGECRRDAWLGSAGALTP